MFLLSIVTCAYLLSYSDETFIEWKFFLVAGLLLGSVLIFAEALASVADYPFSLHWSEGNRIWDYSIAFGQDRYNYTGTYPIFAWIDQGRQTLWGLPFLIPNIPIWAVRLWNALLVTIPYVLFGWVAFKPSKGSHEQWVFVGLWTLIFLNQGPIYTPLVFAAILVALARRRPLWLAVPLLYLAGYYAGISRFTWIFAPAIYVVILTIGDAVLERAKAGWQSWLRGTGLALAAIWEKGLPVLLGVFSGILPLLASSDSAPITQGGAGSPSIETLQGLQATSTTQPFLWERLLPNPVYPPGILLGLALATLPLILLIVYLAKKKYWRTEFWQSFMTCLGLGAMMVVGLVASAKIGGGTDLHNMDMFLVGLVLVAALAWEGGLASRLRILIKQSPYVRWLLAGLVFIPAFLPMIGGRPLELPSAERTQYVLQQIQTDVACARQYGEVLFMDQRQLLTFGQMGDLPLVVDYEKKYVMDKALAGDEAYFEQFRQDLASGRFSMIVTERQAILYKEPGLDSIGDSLDEENNAWVTWVATPL